MQSKNTISYIVAFGVGFGVALPVLLLIILILAVAIYKWCKTKGKCNYIYKHFYPLWLTNVIEGMSW